MDSSIYYPDGFINEEVRDEWLVTEKMKKVWAISIALLEQIRIICERHSLTYYAIGGTAIGAIRHKGFIPWDDDIDIALKRDEYDLFIKYAQEELEYPFFLQTTLNDADFYNKNFARIRHSLSTGISPNDGKLRCNNGIFIDVMPLDSYEDVFSANCFCFFEKIKTMFAWNRMHCNVIENKSILRQALNFLSPIVLGGSVKKFYENHEKKCRKFAKKNYSKLGWMYAWMRVGKDHRAWAFDKDVFDDVIYMDFEYIKVPLPSGYDKMLKHQFGDYMKFPPVESRGKHHDLELNPDVDYKTYCSEKYNVKY